MECLSYCIAHTIDLIRLDSCIKKSNSHYLSVRNRDPLKLSRVDNPHQTIFIFKNGTLVSWGMKRYEMEEFINGIRPLIEKPVGTLVHDEFHFQLGDKTTIKPHDFYDVDCLIIEEDSDEIKLSLSYGFSQSVKLQYFETIIESLIEKYKPMIQTLSSNGKMPVSRQQISQVIGEILGAKSEVNLTSNFLYHPKYFWQHPIFADHFSMLERYLHIPRRINAINHRLDTINEIFDMCNVYLQDKHSHNLEIIIIVLITIEILVGVLKFYF